MPAPSPLTQSSTHLGLTDALPVVTASTTSRVVLDNEKLRVVNFTFDAGQELTEHSTPRAVVCHLTAGRMHFTVDGTTHLLDSGDMIYLAPDAPHALTAETPCRLTLTMVDVDRPRTATDE
ncbi:AraC-like ligand binding domain-containing protein [Austwickia chelonae]|uniref:Cupin type-2 domain-containing protein n=1 Tax=Austwickia chelonae NBRC 105200 TaxID=1184607 RepID=K6UNS7_9MICO|nr:cupin domain-containing protein [Austwickia chelonae]GAB79216.1 hypothetical protein AUCHE_21_00420 [Austwickia chelonae NBRC 105200]SEW37309.1 AraC-like ligand binding domain-containing protein [Austwickia chelonae]